MLQKFKNGIYTFLQHKGILMKSRFAGFILGEIQNIINDIQKGVPALPDDLQILPLGRARLTDIQQ
ncbi:hypothetical protein D3C74_406490 [compost metagenome]